MFKLFLTAVFLVASVQAQTLISSPSPIVTDTVTVQVTFGSCIQGQVLPESFTFSPAGVAVSGGSCQETSARQSFLCTWNLDEVPQGVSEIDIQLPASSVADTSGTGNVVSQSLHLHYVGPLEATLSTEPNVQSYPFTTITYVWTLSHEVISLNVADPFVITGPASTLKSLSLSPSQWSFTINVADGDTVTVAAKAGIAKDVVGQRNSAGNQVTRTVVEGAIPAPTNQPAPTTPPSTLTAPPTVPAPPTTATAPPTNPPTTATENRDCEVSAFGPYSECAQSCSTYSNTFEPEIPTQTRTRFVVVTPSGTGLACPALSETRPCDVPRCFGSSRPRSAETALDCSNNCAPVDPVNFNGRIGERNGCFCDRDCEITGDCCQGYYTNNCCAQGNCVNDPVLSDFVYPFEFPLSCAGSGRCNSAEPLVGEGGSYLCYCDAQCAQEESCCGGFVARRDACLG